LKKEKVLQKLTPMKISEILSKVENVGVTMSFQLTLCCSVFWTLIAITYFLGIFNVVSEEVDACLQAGIDICTKCGYVQILCTTHGELS
jgi:hypothetical protein